MNRATPTATRAPAAPTATQAPGVLTGVAALALLVLALAYPFAAGDSPQRWLQQPLAAAALALLAAASLRSWWPTPGWAALATLLLPALGGAAALSQLAPAQGDAPAAAGFWLALTALALLAVVSVRRSARLPGGRAAGLFTAALFGAWVLLFWQIGVVAFAVPRVLLPAPLAIVASLAEHAPVLAADFVQTVLKAVLGGWAIGCALGFGVAVAIDRAPFLQRGLLPLASLTSAVPLVAVAPIAVMWFGFEWPSKAAVVVLMTFFPMLVSTLAGLQAAGRIERELMHSYAAGYVRTLLALRLPAALPFVFNAAKINATLALIGAIVAEFFGSPTVGLGFRISTEAAKMNMGLVWAAIVVAAVTGSLAYALLVQLERRLAFWHPSVRAGAA